MASKDSDLIAHVFVESYCRSGSKTIKNLVRGSKSAEHVLKIENGSTLPYDISVTTELPDSPPKNPAGAPSIEFTHGTAPANATWTAYVAQLRSRGVRQEIAQIHVIAPQPGIVRIKSPTVQYRIGPSLEWEEPIRSSTLEIDVKIA
jgi:hypothetical protein